MFFDTSITLTALALVLAVILTLLLLRGTGLKVFERTNAPWCWNIAAYHSPRSLTWSWLLSFSLFRKDENRVWPLYQRHSIGQTVWTLRLPFVGLLRWAAQEQMLRDRVYRPRLAA